MTYSDFVILLARQRSGTNAVRSVLASHPDIFCFNEVFNFGDRDSPDSLLRESNFFNFLEKYAADDLARLWPDNQERLFLDFLEYLRCFSTKKYIVVDVKYNTMHFLNRKWSRPLMAPYLLDLIKQYGIRVVNVTRKNYLRYALSTLKAWQSGTYTITATDHGYRDSPVYVDVALLLEEMKQCSAEDKLIANHFRSYSEYISFDYQRLFTGETHGVSEDFLLVISRWLSIPDIYENVSRYRKQASLSLDDAVQNFDEVAEALASTRFAYCLKDEPIHKRESFW